MCLIFIINRHWITNAQRDNGIYSFFLLCGVWLLWWPHHQWIVNEFKKYRTRHFYQFEMSWKMSLMIPFNRFLSDHLQPILFIFFDLNIAMTNCPPFIQGIANEFVPLFILVSSISRWHNFSVWAVSYCYCYCYCWCLKRFVISIIWYTWQIYRYLEDKRKTPKHERYKNPNAYKFQPIFIGWWWWWQRTESVLSTNRWIKTWISLIKKNPNPFVISDGDPLLRNAKLQSVPLT